MIDQPRRRRMPLIGLWSTAALLLLLTSLSGRNFLAQSGGSGATSSNPCFGTITEYPVATLNSEGLVAGPDGNLWLTDRNKNVIRRITTGGVELPSFPAPTPNSTPYGMTLGPDGALWFTETDANKIGRITTEGVTTDFPIPTPNANPQNITNGPDGNIWFAGTGLIGNITPLGIVTTYPATVGSVFGITAGPDGNTWFTNYAYHKISKITPTGTITEYPLPTATGNPVGIAPGPDGNLWAKVHISNKIAKITKDGVITEYPIPTPSTAGYITAGPDGALWFTESSANKIGRVTVTGQITEYAVPTGALPNRITVGPDGNIWFTENAIGHSKLGKLALMCPPMSSKSSAGSSSFAGTSSSAGKSSSSRSHTPVVSCGNGTRDPGEQCDDGNRTNGDGCSASCGVENGFTCTPSDPVAASPVCTGDKPVCSPGGGPIQCPASHPTPTCTQKVVLCVSATDPDSAGVPTCAAANGKDTCAAVDIPEEQASSQSSSAFNEGEIVIAPAECGDGTRDTDEQCDDGNKANGDGCSISCTTESGWLCLPVPDQEPPACASCDAVCGAQAYVPAPADQPRFFTRLWASLFGNGSDSLIAQVGNRADLAWTLSSCACTGAGGSRCTLTVTNGGPAAAPHVRLFLSIVGDGVLVNPQAIGALSNGTVTVPKLRGNSKTVNWGNGDALPGNTSIAGTLSFNMEVELSANLQSDVPDPNRSNDTVQQRSPACTGSAPDTQPATETCAACRTRACPGTGLSSCRTACGDGIRTGNEKCDDGNTKNGDGCSGSCTPESVSVSSIPNPASSAPQVTVSSVASSAAFSSAKPVITQPDVYCCLPSQTPRCFAIPIATHSVRCPSPSPIFPSQQTCTAGCGVSAAAAPVPAEPAPPSVAEPAKPFLSIGASSRPAPSPALVTAPAKQGNSSAAAQLPVQKSTSPLTIASSSVPNDAVKTPPPYPVAQPKIAGSACAASHECGSGLCINGACVSCISDADCAPAACRAGQCIGTCGNGVIEAGEECDAALQNSNTLPNHCRKQCRKPMCGDGVQDAGEFCDDGNLQDGDTCDASCKSGTPNQVLSDIVTGGTVAPARPGPAYPAVPPPEPSQRPLNANGADLTAIATGHAPQGSTGPVAITVMASGAAAGWAWIKRRKTEG